MSPNRVLVVDDEVALGNFIVEVAIRADYDARATADARSFKQQYAEFNPTLIVLDLSMPDVDGIELLRFLEAEHCEAGILIVSGFDQRVLDSAAHLGIARGLRMLGTIPKPVRMATLLELFSKLRHVDPEGAIESVAAEERGVMRPTPVSLQRRA